MAERRTNPSLLRLHFDTYSRLSYAWEAEQTSKEASSQVKRGTLSCGLGVVRFGQRRRKSCCSNQDTGEEPGEGRLQIWKENGKVNRLVKEIPLEFDRTVDAKVEVRQKSGN